MKAVYKSMCPNCGGDITDEELLTNGVCRSCIARPLASVEEVYKALEREGKVMGFKEVLKLQIELSSFVELFKKLIGVPPWSLQDVWARRVFLGHSFAIVAPTGMGKTSFGLAMALYLAMRGKRCYIVVPSSMLVQHLLDKAKEFAERIGIDYRELFVGYHSGMTAKEARESLERLARGDFGVLITTDRFIYNRFELLSRHFFDYLFVDDVDSFLKSPKNIDKALVLIGFSPELVEKALRLVELRRKRRPSEEEKRELMILEGEVEEEKRKGRRGIMVVSGMSLRGRSTKRVQVFRLLLGFEPGFRLEFVRNIANLYLRPDEGRVEETVAKLIKRHGGGCLLFVPQTKGVEYVAKLVEFLKAEGIRAYGYQKMEPKILERFTSGEYEVLVGVASNRSPLARGIDLPEHVRYVIFAGVPRREIKVGKDEHNPQKILTLLRHIAPVLEERYSQEAARITAMLSKAVPLRSETLEAIKRALSSGDGLEGFAGFALNVVREAREFLSKAMTDEGVRRLSERLDIYVRVDEDGYSIIVPDVVGYVQASGRASRLYAGGISRGVAITVVDDEKSLHGLLRRIEIVAEEEFEEYNEERAAEEFGRVDEDREKIAKLRKGEAVPERYEGLKAALVVVESPTKAHTIASFFGRPARRQVGELTIYESSNGEVVLSITSTQGHVFDLSTVGGYHGVLMRDGIYVPIYTDIRRCKRCNTQFTDLDRCPMCDNTEFFSKRSVVEALRRLAAESSYVLIATDPDAEGEKIGYDIYCNLYPYNRQIGRLEFHEVTRKALRKALRSTRGMKVSLVEAQTVRRVEDRWVGFELSRKLWERFGRRTLSAGRVQTPVLGWVIQRMEEVKKKRLVANLTLENGMNVELIDPPSRQELEEAFKKGELTAEVIEVSREEENINPPPPYTTDSMLRDAANQLGFSVGYTMRLAQTLFEMGLITYHRTDSTAVSTTGMGVARQYIEENYPGNFKPRAYRAEGAHECIRPTRPLNRRQLEFYISSEVIRLPGRIGKDEFALYDMIFRRFIASQMVEARVLVQRLKVKVGGAEQELSRVVKVIEPGFLSVMPLVRELQEARPGEYRVVELSFRKVPAAWLLREGDVIAMMKERGIGRPSTYSKILEVLFERGYVFENRGRILSTRLGQQVYDYLSANYGNLVSEELTRQLESTMDAVEKGEANYQEVLKSLHSAIEVVARGS